MSAAVDEARLARLVSDAEAAVGRALALAERLPLRMAGHERLRSALALAAETLEDALRVVDRENRAAGEPPAAPGNGRAARPFRRVVSCDLDVHPAPGQATPAPRPDTSARRRGGAETVLVVDDDDDVRLMVRTVLERGGLRVVEAVDGEAALAVVAHARPDLVLLDLTLPVMDGVEVCGRLRAAEATRALTIVMLTASTDPVDRQRAAEAGVDDYVTKPVLPSALLARVAAHLGTA